MKKLIITVIIILASITIINAQTIVNTISGLVTFQVKNPTCGKANGSIIAIITDTIKSDYSYYWMHGELTTTAKYLSADVYTFVIIISGKEYYETVYLSDIDGPEVNAILKNEKCVNSNDGSIFLSNATGKGRLNYKWVVTGKNDSSLTNLKPDDYAVVISNSFNCRTINNYPIKQAIPLSFTENNIPESCGSKQDGVINITVTGGNKPYHIYLNRLDTMIKGVDKATSSFASFTNLSSGVYNIVITDSNICKYNSRIILQSAGANDINYIITWKGTIQKAPIVSNLTGNGPFSIKWVDTTNREIISTSNALGKSLGYYILKISDSLGCNKLQTFALSQSPSNYTTLKTDICIVTVDSTSGNNILIWIKHDLTSKVFKYEVFRETLVPTIYTSLGIVNYSNPPIFVDTVANPLKRSWKYKVVAITDTTRNSDYSKMAEHKSIHLNLDQSVSGAPVNLIWDSYIGFAFTYFYIYRGYNNIITCIDSVPTKLTAYYSYIDSKPPVGYLFYYVGVKLPAICTANNLKIKEGPYSMSISNLEDNRMKADTTNNIKNQFYKSTEVFLYPNPTSNKLCITSELIVNEGIELRILNYEGILQIQKSVHNNAEGRAELNIEGLASGLYILNYRSNKSNGCIKFIKQ